LLPFALDRGFGGERLQGLETDQALDQGGVALRAGAVGGFGEGVHAPLHGQRVEQQHRRADEQGHQHRRRDPADHEEKDQRKRQVDERHHGGRANEVAHRLEGAQIGGEGAGRGWALLHAHAQHALHDEGRQLDVGAAAGQVHEAAAHDLEHQVTEHDDGDTGREHPQGVESLVGHHAVIDVHHEQRHGDREQIGQERRQQHVAVQAPVFGDHAPEPVLAAHRLDHWGARVVAGARPGVEGAATVAGLDLRRGQIEHRLAQLGENHAHAGAVGAALEQHTGRLPIEQQHRRQQLGAQFGDGLTHQLAAQASAVRGALEQRRRQPPVWGRQAGQGAVARQRLPVQARQHDQAVQQVVALRRCRLLWQRQGGVWGHFHSVRAWAHRHP
jgi:hypothetical protein